MVTIKTKQVYTGIAPIRNSITWTNNRKFFAFATLNDICFAKAEVSLGDSGIYKILKTNFSASKISPQIPSSKHYL